MYRKCGIAFALIKKDGMLKFFTVCFPKWARVAGYKSDRMNYSKGVISGFFFAKDAYDIGYTQSACTSHVRTKYQSLLRIFLRSSAKLVAPRTL